MYCKSVTVSNSTGLHARPASTLVAEAKKFESKITIRRVGEESAVNIKSMIKLLTLGICQGQTVEIGAEGADEIAAVDTLVALIASGFGE